MRMSSGFFVLTLLCAAVPAFAQAPTPEPGPTTIAVKGVGEATVQPDLATVELAVVTIGPTLAEATASHLPRASRSAALLNGMKLAGIRVTRTTFNLTQNRSVAQPGAGAPSGSVKPTPPTFTARTGFELEVRSIDKLSESLTQIVNSGELEVNSVLFKVTAERDALNKARRAAMLDAREQAETYADAAGLKLLEIMQITDGEAQSNQGRAYDLPVRGARVEITPPEALHFTGTVNVTWHAAAR